jgi:hypothetical protein
MKSKIFLSFFLLLLFLSKSNSYAYTPEVGDLLFQNLDGPMVDAIEKCTVGINGWRFSHVAIIFTTEPRVLVLEAGDRVKLTPFKEFLDRTKKNGFYKTVVGKIQAPYRSLIPVALRYGRKLVGSPFDPVFELNNGAYYCAELIYEIFKRANGGKAVFPLVKMNFKNLQTGKIDEIWIRYFKYFNRPVPQGKLGVNPAEFTKLPFIKIITPFNWP